MKVVDLVLAQQERDAVDVALHALVLERHHLLQIELGLDLDPHGAEIVVRFLVEARTRAAAPWRGMQPTLRHVPPCVARFSTTATFMPSCAARMAQT